VEHVTEGMEPADAHSIKPVSQLVQRMAANLGGTEMPAAIRETIRIPVPAGARADLVLITDGEVHAVDEVVEVAVRSSHRLFVIAIGAAPNEALARKVSERTGGACDFVAAGEQVEGAILRMFGRLRAAPRTIAHIDWSTPPDWTAPLPSAVFPHDTIHVMAGFRVRPEGSARVTVAEENGSTALLDVKLAPHLCTQDVVPRIAAAQRLAVLDEAEARELAVRYQLVSQFTSLVLVAERAESDKVLELPATVAVPHMLAAGWGGVAEVAAMCLPAPRAGAFEISFEIPSHSIAREAASMEPDALYARLARYGYADPLPDRGLKSHMEIPDNLRSAIVAAVAAALANGKVLPQNVNELDAMCKLPDEFKSTLSLLCALNDEEEAIFIRALLEHLDRKDNLISFPAIGAVDRIRIRALRRHIGQALPVEGESPLP
jgi:Ca-activated chloride channel family protein